MRIARHAFRYALLLLAAWLLASLQGRWLTQGRLLLDPFLLVTLIYGIRRKPPAGTLAGLGAGLFQDVLTGTLLGLHGFAKTLIGYLCHGFGGRLLLTNPVPRAVVFVSCTLADRLVLALLHLLLRGSFPFPALGTLLLSCLVNAAAGLVVLQILDSRERRVLLRT